MDKRKVIVCGVPRSGKSTLGRHLANILACSHIPCDPLVSTFQEMYPAAGIYHTNGHHDQEDIVSRAFTQFLITYITHGLDKELPSYVIEWFHIDIPLLYQHLWQTHTIIIVGYPFISVAEKYEVVRRVDESTAWTAAVADHELYGDIEWFIALSRKQYACAQWHGIPFVDTSYQHIRTIFAAVGDFPLSIEKRIPTWDMLPWLEEWDGINTPGSGRAAACQSCVLSGAPYSWKDDMIYAENL